MEQKRGLLVTVLAALLVSPTAAGAGTPLLPGVSYRQEVRLIGGAPVELHVLTAPRPGGLYALRPVLSNRTVLGRRTIPQMQAAVGARATTAGVNGDFSRWDDGQPSGVFFNGGVLAAGPNANRSALAIGADGRLLVDRFRLAGSWRTGTGHARALERLNGPLASSNGVVLYTPAFGGRTPRKRGVREVVLAGFPKPRLDRPLTGTVVGVRRNGGQPVPPGGAVLQARGTARAQLAFEAPVGTQVTVRLDVRDIPVDVNDAIGGGPELVRDGKPRPQTDEWFTLSQLRGRHPRTAVGQLADGRIILVVADGRSRVSVGLTNAAMARTMADLGAVTAMGLDGGGSSIMSFDGQVLNRPSDGAPRPVSSALLVFYYGIFAPHVPVARLSPNGDGVADRTAVSAKLVRRSAVDLRLLRPDGTTAWRRRDVVGPGWLKRAVGSPAMPEGTWRWSVEAVPEDGGPPSSMTRTFTVDKTLGHLRLSRERLRVPPRSGRRLGISVQLTRRAQVTVRIATASGSLRRVVFAGRAGPGRTEWRWNGRNQAGRVVAPGIYAVEVRARSALGTVSLSRRVVVVRAPKQPG